VEGAYVDFSDACRIRQDALQPDSHFQSGFPGEGHRHYLFWFNDLIFNKMGDSMRESSGLSGSGTSQNQKGSFNVFHCGTLRFSEMF
jgi:hypothetical protein